MKKFAVEKEIPVLQPKNLKSSEFIKELKSYNADVQVVVAFRMLPLAVWDMPPLGTINIHASLLPDYRGAAPINWAIMNGEKESGITTFQLKHEIDTGDILLQEKTYIGTNETAGELHDRLAVLGGEVICKTLYSLINESLVTIAQAFSEANKKAPKIFKANCKIDWSQKTQTIHNHIRGLSPHPRSLYFSE